MLPEYGVLSCEVNRLSCHGGNFEYSSLVFITLYWVSEKCLKIDYSNQIDLGKFPSFVDRIQWINSPPKIYMKASLVIIRLYRVLGNVFFEVFDNVLNPNPHHHHGYKQKNVLTNS